jgi:Ca2+-binding RTX toxin-like protein
MYHSYTISSITNISRSHYEQALNYSNENTLNPGKYGALNDNCFTSLNVAYRIGTGTNHNFTSEFSQEELDSVGLAGKYARIFYAINTRGGADRAWDQVSGDYHQMVEDLVKDGLISASQRGEAFMRGESFFKLHHNQTLSNSDLIVDSLVEQGVGICEVGQNHFVADNGHEITLTSDGILYRSNGAGRQLSNHQIIEAVVPYAGSASYQIKPGDNLSTIALHYGTTVEELQNLNPQIINSDQIFAGDNIRVRDNNNGFRVNIDNQIFKIYDADYSHFILHSNLLQPNQLNNDNLYTLNNPLNNQTHTVVQGDANVTLIDGTIVPISSLIDMHLEANAALVDYNTSDYSFILDSLKDPQLISGWMIEISNGVAAHQSVEEIAKIIAIRTIVNQAAHKVSNATLNLYFTDEERQIANYAFANNQTIDQAVSNMGSDELSQETASKIALLEQSTGFQIAYGAVKAFAVAALIHHDDGLDRQEYGQLAVQAVATTAANTFVTDYFAQQGSGAAGAGVAAFVVAMVSAGVNDMFADDHMDSRQWHNTAVNAAALGAAAAAGYAIGVAVAETYFITAGAAVGGPVGAAVAGMILALSGGLIGGPEYGPGEYTAPYDFLKIVPKADGTGNEIYGLVREGVVAIASEYGDDDIYGTLGQDILIGKEGKNIIFGYDGSDHIEGRGNEDKLFGGNDNDDISGGSGNDYIAGGDGDDVIAGDEGDDQILAGNGNDLVKGGQGDDQIEAEDGDDIVYGGIGNDVVLGGRGNDIIFGDEGDDVIYGEDGDDLLIGGDGNDIISGGDGNDNVSGGIGNDNIKGDNGDDIIYGNSGNDTIHGDAGNDQIQGGQGDDLIFGGIGNDIISGGSDNDQILGEIGDDYLIGYDGDDVISGGGGNDVIYGGQGVDHLKGGDGDDLFLFKIGDGQDVIDDGDVSGNDVIKLVDINRTYAPTILTLGFLSCSMR